METYIAFLRGINVGGHKKFLKSDQLALLTSLSFESPQVYLHTGNWIFKSSENTKTITQKIKKGLLKTMGWEVPVLVVSATNLKVIFNNCPFPEVQKKKSYFVLLAEIPSEENIKKAQSIQYPNESIEILGSCIYYHATHGYGKAKFNMNTFEKILKVEATSRNYNTISKIQSFIS